MIVCLYEDRIRDIIGVKILIASLLRHCPRLRIDLVCPCATVEFKNWLRDRAPVVTLRTERLATSGWNIKPARLLHLLDEGHEQVIWIDSDVLVLRDFRPLMASIEDDVFVATEEYYYGEHQGGRHRAESWGMEATRSLPRTVNSGFMRITPHHRPLLESWKELLNHPRYLEAQSKPWYERPIHLLADQDLLTALLAAVKFADVPVRLLRSGTEIIQGFGPAGYSPLERIENAIYRSPYFVHSMGGKPWTVESTPSAVKAPRNYYNSLYLELSAYVTAAQEYETVLDEPCEWMYRGSAVGRLLRTLTFRNPHLQGLPQAAVHAVLVNIRRSLGLYAFRIERSALSQ